MAKKKPFDKQPESNKVQDVLDIMDGEVEEEGTDGATTPPWEDGEEETVVPDQQATPKKDLVRVEGSKEVAPRDFSIGIRGFDEIPPSIMPTPWIYLVQSNSSKTILSDGSEAAQGNFYLKDSQSEIPMLEMVFLRSKRVVEKSSFNNKTNVKIMTLGLNVMDNFSPFLISWPRGSFSAVGMMMKKMMKLEVVDSWEYLVSVTTEKVLKDVFDEKQGKMVPVKFYAARFEIGEKFSEKQIKDFEDIYLNLGGTLDRGEPEAAGPSVVH